MCEAVKGETGMIKALSNEGECKLTTDGDLTTMMSDLVVLNIAVIGDMVGNKLENAEVFERLINVLCDELKAPVIKEAYMTMVTEEEQDGGKD